MQVYLTGIKATGNPHLGNYLGAIKPAIDDANGADIKSFYFIADYHSLTTVHDRAKLREKTREVACVWLACGLDPRKTVFYRQSDIPEIFEISTILGNYTAKGLMDRAHAFKAAKDAGHDVNIGLFTYPILMSADILTFNANFVPVGSDQQQHVEIATDIAGAFNAIHGKTFVVPKASIKKDVAVIAGLDGRKMSKSYNNEIPLFCPEADLLKYIKKIPTDSTPADAPKDRTHLIFQLYRHFTGAELDNKIGWGDAKMRLFDAVNAVISPMREKYNQLTQNYAEVEKILREGAERARVVSRETISRVRAAIGVS